MVWTHIESLRREAEEARLAYEARRSVPTTGRVRVRLARWLMMTATRLWPDVARTAPRTCSPVGDTR
jgi:hypothetical protein